MRRVLKRPVKLDEATNHCKSWIYWAPKRNSFGGESINSQGYLTIDDLGLTSSASSDVATTQPKKPKVSSNEKKSSSILLNTANANSVFCFCVGKVSIKFLDPLFDSADEILELQTELKFDMNDPSGSLLARVCTKPRPRNFIRCSVQWTDKFHHIDGHTYDADDLLIDLSKANRRITCQLSFVDSIHADIYVRLSNVDENFIHTNDLPPLKHDVAVAYILRYFQGIPVSLGNRASGHSCDSPADWLKLFSLVKYKSSPVADISDISRALKPLTTKLRPYQLEGVKWMLAREKAGESLHKIFSSAFEEMFAVIPGPNESAFFYNKYSCKCYLSIPMEMSIPSGGILADEMGLGKTLEVLALILANPYKEVIHIEPKSPKSTQSEGNDASDNKTTYFSCICGDFTKTFDVITCNDCGSVQHVKCVGRSAELDAETYRCPYCIFKCPPVASRATLVVTPMTISTQWADEVTRHFVTVESGSALKVFTYQGVKNSCLYVQPQVLADNDIVLVSYETLRSELANANLQFEDRSSSLRTAKRFMAVPSPLPAIRWWRLCLDEAQMVESPNNAAKMVNMLSSVHRWCITGTPIVNGINDLFGLMVFLRYPIFSCQLYWDSLISKPYFQGNSDPLVDLLSTIFWRTSKFSVLDQIGVPPLTETVTCLTFTPVEEHIYRHRYNLSKLQSAVAELAQLNRKTLLRHLDRRVVKRFLDPMVPLRRACSDLGKRTSIGLHSHGHHNNSVKLPAIMTMDQVLKDLISRAVTTCTDYHRQFVCSLNGLAGMNLIDNNLKQAGDLYRQVLWSARDNASVCETDKLQLIHAIHNLNDVLQLAAARGDTSVDRATGDDNLLQQKASLISSFVEKLDTKVSENKETIFTAQEKIRKIDTDLYDEWWAEVCDQLLRKMPDDDICDFFLRLQHTLRDICASNSSSLISKASSVHGLLIALSKRLDTLESLRKDWRNLVISQLAMAQPTELCKEMAKCSCTVVLPVTSNSDELQQSQLAVRSTGTCAFCLAMESCVDYEKCLFSSRRKVAGDSSDNTVLVQTEANNNTDDVWAWSESEVERTLKFLLSFAKRHQKRFSANYSESDVVELFEAGNKHIERFQVLKVEFRHLRQLWMSLKDRVGAENELRMASNRTKSCDVGFFEQEKAKLSKNSANKTSTSLLMADGTVYVTADQVPHLITSYRLDADFAKSNFDKACGQLRYLRCLEKSVSSSEKPVANNEEACPVCFGKLGVSWAVLPCAHCVCLECVTTLRSMVLHNRRLPCPVCRYTLEQHELAYVSLRPVDEVFPDEHVVVNGNYSTKIMAVVKIIKVVLLRDTSSKILVFSAWMDVLNSLVHVLQENAISALVLQKSGGARNYRFGRLGEPAYDKFTNTLRRFRAVKKDGDSNSAISVLLLPYSSGANGLNLVEANHVVLMDPCLTASTDAQAIARVYRMGQTKPTTVHRLLIRSTIEERIYKALLKKRASHDHVEDEESQDANGGTATETGGAGQDIDAFDEDAVIGDLVDLYNSELSSGIKLKTSSDQKS